jgi:signal transduction histidine kinase/ActR/RegA family two-component response regulator
LNQRPLTNGARQGPPTRPLRVHFLALSLGALLPVVIFSAALVFQLARQARSVAQDRLLQGARTTAASLDRMFEANVHALEALAQSEDLENLRLDDFWREAFRMEQAQPPWIAVTLQFPGGAVLVDARASSEAGTHHPDDAPSLEAVLRTRGPAVSDLITAPGADPAFQVRVPVLRNDRSVRYVLTATVRASAVADIQRAEARPVAEWSRAVVDGRGVVVARTRDPWDTVGRPSTPTFLVSTRSQPEGVFSSVTFEGVPSYVAFRRSWLSGWVAAVVVERARLDAPVRTMALGVSGLGLSAVLFAALGAFLVSRRLSRGIVAASRAADDLAEGRRPELAASGVEEVDRLSDALARSAELLAERERERDHNLARAEASRAEAERESRAKDEFLAMLGHELRNPLAPIVSAVELLRRRGLDRSRELAVIDRQARQLVHLTDDLLDIARITRGRIALRLEPVRLASAVSRAAETVGPILEERGHQLNVDVPSDLVVRGDPVRLAQVVGNLLSNAARYTPPGGHIQVRARRESGQAVLEVEDDGQGMPPDLVSRAFDLFVQGPRAPDRHEGGLGLGLTLVRRLVELHGGSVSARSPGPGRGSTFTVALPTTAEAPAPAPVARPAHSSRGHRILVVDDNADSAELMSELLSQAGHQVIAAHDGFAALRALDGFDPEVAFLDVGLPVMDGYELAGRIAQRLGDRAPAFVSITGYGQPSDRERSRAAGFQRHVVKPADPGELLEIIEEVTAERTHSSQADASG